MARPKSDEKHQALLEAATRCIVEHGLGASTAGIARDGRPLDRFALHVLRDQVSASQQLFVTLKSEVGRAAMHEVVPGASSHEQFARMWSDWMRWSVANPDKRRAISLLAGSGDITDQSHHTIGLLMAPTVCGDG